MAEFLIFMQGRMCEFTNSPNINILALGEEADIQALNCLPAMNFIRSTKLQLSTEPAFLPNACCQLFFYSLNPVALKSFPVISLEISSINCNGDLLMNSVSNQL